jgi:hypothetical protein
VAEVCSTVKSAGAAAFNSHGALAVIDGALSDAKNAGARQAGLAAIESIMTATSVAAEPYLVPLMPKVLELLSDKVRAPRRATGASDCDCESLQPTCRPAAAQITRRRVAGALDGGYTCQSSTRRLPDSCHQPSAISQPAWPVANPPGPPHPSRR